MNDVLKNLSDGLAEAVQAASPSVVRVDARHRLPATGIVWSADGLIVTAHHVVERDDTIRVGLHDGSTLSAKLIGRDPNNDLALLKADGTFTAAMWAAENSIKVGHLVLALGRPVGDLQATLGVVSAIVGKDHLEPEEHHGRHFRRMRRRMWGHALADGFIRTDVVMYPGFSGGPLVSSYGTVYGLNTSGFTRGASLTVPVGTIRKSVEALMKHGKVRQGYLGVGVQAVRLPENIGDRETGVLIISVERDSPAQQAGLLVGDIIVAIGDETVEEVEELLRALHGEVVGKEVAVQIVRGGQLKTVSVTIGERA